MPSSETALLPLLLLLLLFPLPVCTSWEPPLRHEEDVDVVEEDELLLLLWWMGEEASARWYCEWSDGQEGVTGGGDGVPERGPIRRLLPPSTKDTASALVFCAAATA